MNVKDMKLGIRRCKSVKMRNESSDREARRRVEVENSLERNRKQIDPDYLCAGEAGSHRRTPNSIHTATYGDKTSKKRKRVSSSDVDR